MKVFASLLMMLSVLLAGCASTPDPSRTQMHVYIVHGYAASPSDHWFPWLRQKLAQQGARVTVIELPSPDAPRPDEWQQAIARQVGVPDQHSYFVAHSLGSIALLRYLDSTPADTRIGGYILVSGFNDRLPALPQLDAFAAPDLDYARLVGMTRHRIVIAAVDDAIVPFPLTRDLAAEVASSFLPVERGGHFLASDGYRHFPLVLQELERAAQSRRGDSRALAASSSTTP
jgi:predicted alpha/beta hydrolase family esterase